MTVALLIRDLGYAGAQRQLVHLALGLAQRGHQVHLLTFYSGPLAAELQGSGVTLHHLTKAHRWDVLGFLWRIISTLRALRPDALYAFLTESHLLSALLRPLLPGTQIIWGLRDSETDSGNFGLVGRLVFQLATRLSGWADLHVANSHCGARYYAQLGYAEDRLSVIPNGIDTERFCRNEAARAAVRAELGIQDEGVLLLGLIGRLSPMKDHETFLHALAHAFALKELTGRSMPKIIVWIIGAGPEDYAQRHRALAEKLGLAQHIRWSAPRHDMPAVLSALDLLISSSAYGEGFSNVTGEAMACGTPCLVTDVGDSALLVADTGWVVPPRDPLALGQMLHQVLLLTHHERRARGQAARQRMAENFTIPRMVQRSEAALTVALEGSNSRSPQRLLFIITALGSGGAELQLTQLITQLENGRFAPEVITLVPGGKHAATLAAAGIPVHSLNLSPGQLTPRALWQLIALTRQIQPSLIIGWMYHANFLSTLAGLSCGMPVLWNVRQSIYDLALEKRSSALVIRALAVLSWQPHSIVYNSAVSAQQHEALGYNVEKTLLLPNGIDVQRYHPQPAARSAVLAELGLPADTLLVGRIGRNTGMKDYPTFLAAAAMLKGMLPQVHCITAGTGTQDLPTMPGVTHLGERHDLPLLNAALDVACSSSAYGEGFPNVLAEAMACAVPCVATDIGDSAWLLQEPQWMVAARDAQALAQKLVEILSLPLEQRQALAQRLRQRVEQHFALRDVTESFEQLFHHASTSA
jgi:glycosyltransferase involved in cell wall biosynthesis